MPPSLNLEQRLAALTISQSSSTQETPRISESSSTSRASLPKVLKQKLDKPFNFASWSRAQRGIHDFTGVPEEEVSKEVVQKIMGRLIFQAGVDYETRPMVVFSASALPDPKEVPYDLLLSRILSYLDLYVESDYTVVFFTAGGRHTPTTNWIWKTYQSLNRKYRKNLKQLYIVHSSFFSKMLLTLAGAILSPKFFQKIVYIKSLSELAQFVPLTQIDVPLEAYKENLKFEKTITLPIPTHSGIFGVPLEDLMGYEGEKGGLPRVVKDSIQYIYENGLEEMGIFRRCPQSSLLRAAQEAYDRGNVLSLDNFRDPHIAAVLLKKFLRALPEPLFPERLYIDIQHCPQPPSPQSSSSNDLPSVTYIRESLLSRLPPCVYILLSHILQLMHEISLRAHINMMTASNLSLVLCPNLVKGSNPALDVMMCGIPGSVPAIMQSNAVSPLPIPVPKEGQTSLGSVILVCIRRYYEIFDDVKDRSEPSRQRSSDKSRDEDCTDVDEDSIDDAVLVMPVGPGPVLGGSENFPVTTHHSRRRSKSNTTKPTSGVLPAHSIFTESEGTRGEGSFEVPSWKKALSTNKDDSVVGPYSGLGTVSGRKRSLSLLVNDGGKGMGSVTMRQSKAVGSSVEAMGITAKGFFMPPGNEEMLQGES